jgi:phosphonate degradation associated HDIG domain protein
MNPPAAHPAIAAIRQLFQEKGELIYGEAVNQVQHALQCGALAEAQGAAPSLVVAAVLHDVGHMLHRDAAGAVQAGDDDRHERLGAKFLLRWFGPEVAEPVRLHVDAKRYLCTREPGYWAALSPLSQRTLEIQGGPFTEEQARAFEQLPHAMEAVSVRRWDDDGKKAGVNTPGLEHYLALAAECAMPIQQG